MSVRETTFADVERAVAEVSSRSEEFSRLGVEDRLRLLARLRSDVFEEAESWVRVACEIKRIDFDAPVSAEEWLGGPVVTLRHLRLLERTLRRREPPASRPVAPGLRAVRVLPADATDSVLFAGIRAETWIEAEGAPESSRPAGTCLVLGAGNVSCIGPADVLHRAFALGQVAVLKMHPVLERLGPSIERAFRALIEPGYLRVVYGGADVGDALVRHPAIDSIHITGSGEVHDAIVWGTGDDARRARVAGEPRIRKPITSELGCVTPVIVVPGRWSRREIRFQAESIASMLANNVSCNCVAAKVLVTDAAWPQRRELLDELARVLGDLPTRVAYYPGSTSKYEAFLAAHPEARRIGRADGERLAWAIVEGVDPASERELAFEREAWSPVLVETSIVAGDPVSFLERASRFANDRLAGTLSCSVIVDPRVERANSAVLQRAIEELRYGTVAINIWSGVAFGICATPWGAYPGHTLDAVGSGIGFVHDTAMVEATVGRVRKAVLRAPFVVRPRPPWFVGHATAHRVAKLMAAHEARPSWLRVPRIAWAALRG